MDNGRLASHTARDALIDQVRNHTGIHMAPSKWTMLQGRLRKRLRELDMQQGDWHAYLAMLERQPKEVERFINLVTTNETSFFRTPRIWDYLWQDYLPQWSENHRGVSLGIWSAAAATGEEAYSAAMLCEQFRAQHADFRYRILATDIAQQVLQTATRGCYSGRSIQGLRQSHPERLASCFRPRGDDFEVIPALRAAVTFQHHHLFDPLPGKPQDLVLLRNVLIYFDEAGQRAVLARVHAAMADDGILIVGESESLNRLGSGFVFDRPSIYRKGGA